jgi:hypothetical protein
MVKRADFVSERMSCKIVRGRSREVIFRHAPIRGEFMR